MQKKTILSFMLTFLLLISSCSKRKGMPGVELNIKTKPEAITDFLFVNMDYEYRLASDFKKMTSDYKIFTHLWRPATKEMLLVDDHMPVKNTSQWNPGETIQYARTFFIPQFLNEFDIDFEGYEEIRLSVGFYDPDPKTKMEPVILFEKKINIQPASATKPEIVFSDGWEEMETDMKSTDPFTKNWQWTNQSAVCIIDNPKKVSTLIIKGGVNKSVLADQKVILKINDQLLEEFIPASNVFSKEYTINPDKLGNGDEFTLKIETDKTFVPAKIDPSSRDTRELGIQVFFLYFREKAQ